MADTQTPGTKKWVYLFREGEGSWRDLLGGKGAGLAAMATLAILRGMSNIVARLVLLSENDGLILA